MPIRALGITPSHAGWHDDRHQVVLDSSPLEISPDLEPDGRIMDAFKAHQDLGMLGQALGNGLQHQIVDRILLAACTAWDTSFSRRY